MHFSILKTAIPLMALLLSGLHLPAQDFLRGVVAEEDEKGKLIPLYGVNIYWKGTSKGTSTDTNGVFRIADDHQNHQLIFSYVGYANDTVSIVNHQDLMIVLKNARVIDEVEIVYRRQATNLSTMDHRHTEVLNEKELFKAACCNLSESFETNASIDASYADAISGTRQIQMLGLAGVYTMITMENLPSNRGLATVQGLVYTPGAWLDNISISKGAGSVVNGFESITGQINTDIRKPEEEDRFYLNLYGGEGGRYEANTDYKIHISERWSTSVLLHGRILNQKNDMNDDGFLDMPLNETFIGMNRWKYQGVKGLESEFGLKYVDIDNRGGQVLHDFDKSDDLQTSWGMKSETARLEAFAKVGIVFPERKYSSIGLQMLAVDHNAKSNYGHRVYDGLERSYYSNLIYQNIIGTSDHKYRIGLSMLYDEFDENFDSVDYVRTEKIPGAFAEYTYTFGERVVAVGGIRADDHNIYGLLLNSSLHLRYSMDEKTTLRLSGGTGTRVANILAENTSYMASSRKFIIPGNDKAFGMNPEKAINMGISMSRKFTIDYRDGEIVCDFFRTEFLEQVVTDVDYSAREVGFYNLDGKSFANSFQIQVSYEVLKRLDMRIAYRYNDVRTEFREGLLEKAMLARNKGFINLAYESKKNKKFGQWRYDATMQFIGRQRLPHTSDNPEEYRMGDYSPAYALLNAQVTRAFSKAFEIYLGGENILDFRQDKAILSADDPYGPNFDASMVWAPIFGRMIYTGLRLWIK